MNANATATSDRELNARLAHGGFRFTPQRQHVYSLLLEKRDHPTADEVYMRSRRAMPEISMATVYNCLDALVKCGLVRQVNIDRAATRYCPNMDEHCHFYCEDCGGVFDISLPHRTRPPVAVPEGFRPSHYELSIRGQCPRCRSTPARAAAQP
jgi:Fur family peroxide stress response transcriptional regulator